MCVYYIPGVGGREREGLACPMREITNCVSGPGVEENGGKERGNVCDGDGERRGKGRGVLALISDLVQPGSIYKIDITSPVRACMCEGAILGKKAREQ